MIQVDVRRRLGDTALEMRFETPARGVTALFGRSGAGKTSLINMLAGLLRPDSGRISVGDRVLFDSERGIDIAPEKRRVGYVFQDARLFPHLSVKDNLDYGRRKSSAKSAALSFNAVTDLLGIQNLLDRRPNDLSGGEKQRVAIGRALLTDPRILLMDEPLASLDTARREEIMPFIERLRDELGLPIVYVSHTIDEVIRLADRLVLIADGTIAALGTVEELTARLDLRPLTGRFEAGAVLPARVMKHDQEFHLTTLSIGSVNRLQVPQLDMPVGAALRLRIRARDVALALNPPWDVSILNILPGRISEISEEDGSMVDVLVDVGVPLWARITTKARRTLGLKVGAPIHALIKAVAVDRHSAARRAENNPGT